jgi:trans-aconitate 2-methyltransferase
MDTWDPAQYSKFQREREQPFFDLVDLIEPTSGMRVVDLGCGTGNLTRLLHLTVNAAETLGIDRSDRMLDVARSGPPEPGLRFQAGTIESFEGHGEYDLIFSNAAFHWISDHESLLRRLSAALKPGGQLAFQVPAMHDTFTHQLADQLTTLKPFRDAFGGWTRPQPVLPPAEYARLLFKIGFPAPSVRLFVYPHVLPGRDDVLEWMKGTLLTEYEKRLTPELFARFTDMYRERVLPELEDARPFFFPFKRILCWAKASL